MGLNAAAVAPLARLVAVAGRAVAWLTLVMTLLTFLVVLLRYGFNQGWIWMQESVTYLHATVFMVAAAWALQADEHVRVDIFYRERSDRYRAGVDLAGTVMFLLPFSVFMLYIGWDYVAAAWAVREASSEPGGLPLVWLLKSLVLVLPGFLLLQAVVTALECIAVLRSGRPVAR
ncbi:MAG: TRAP transporter small permease subunit [Gammaproteobacteria bacterium]|nr:TRAP transporter small permease subunit [Gammaproteobacteria bacterium]